jgi:4,5-DOPA dioxygenase extradiol
MAATAAGAFASVEADDAGGATRRRAPGGRIPVLFVSHGSPMVAVERDAYTDALARFGNAHRKPAAIVVVSAHFLAPPPVRVTASAAPETIHDFGGFPDELYAIRYPAPGAPALARDIAAALEKERLPSTLDGRRGHDHGTWVPLRLGWPEADVPVVSVSLPAGLPPAELVRMGRALAPLRERGVLLVGSGGIVHNLRRVRFGEKEGAPEPWAAAFDAWIETRVAKRDVDALVGYRTAAPHAALAAPTTEHFDPLFIVLGASDDRDRFRPVFEGIHYGNLSMRTFALG